MMVMMMIMLMTKTMVSMQFFLHSHTPIPSILLTKRAPEGVQGKLTVNFKFIPPYAFTPFYLGTHTATTSTITIFLRHYTALRAGHLDGLSQTIFLNHVQQDFGLTWGPKVLCVSYSLLALASTQQLVTLPTDSLTPANTISSPLYSLQRPWRWRQ